MNCGDSIRVVYPLFQVEDDGSIPISPLQFEFGQIDRKIFVGLNELWHSRLPVVTNCFEGICYGAEYLNNFYAVAWWSKPIAREYSGKGYFELRRMAISDDSPKNTASRFLSWMRKDIQKRKPDIVKLISYQDTDVHNGTIYKASGWVIGGEKNNIGTGWNTRKRSVMQSTSNKIRWEYDL